MRLLGKALTFDDVLLVPAYSQVLPRDTSLATRLSRNIALNLPLGYRDQWVFITAAEIKLSKHWIWDLGYHYATNPIPRENLNSISSIFTQHHAATGIRYQKDNWWVGVSYIIAFPTTMTAGGNTAIPLGIDYAFGRINEMQNTIIAGAGFSIGGKKG